jgi:hypothetical protein
MLRQRLDYGIKACGVHFNVTSREIGQLRKASGQEHTNSQ